MRKFFVSIMAVCFALLLAAPSMAEMSGHMRVRGFSMANPGLNADDQDSNAFYDTRLRLQTVIKPTDKISLTIRADILDGYKLGTVGAYAEAVDSIDMDRAYLTILSDYGKFDIGRMKGGAWGNTFGDYEGDFDRIKYTLPYSDKLTLVGIVQKSGEGDSTAVTGSDNDVDVYYLAGIYKLENGVAGLLGAYLNGRSDPAVDTNKRVLIPYYKGKFGDLGIQAELIYEFGDVDKATGTDQDISGLSYNVEATYDIPGPFSFEAGYAFASGDDDVTGGTTDTEVNAGNMSYGGIGYDWDKFVVFSDADCLINTPGSDVVKQYGVKLWYVGAKYALTEDITLWGNIGGATADQSGTAESDDYGLELDVNMSWNVMDNLTYTLRLGFLNAGDIWKDINGVTEVDDTFTIYHKLQVDF